MLTVAVMGCWGPRVRLHSCSALSSSFSASWCCSFSCSTPAKLATYATCARDTYTHTALATYATCARHTYTHSSWPRMPPVKDTLTHTAVGHVCHLCKRHLHTHSIGHVCHLCKTHLHTQQLATYATCARHLHAQHVTPARLHTARADNKHLPDGRAAGWLHLSY